MRNKSLSYRAFSIFNYSFLIGTAIICLLPIIHILAVSFSSANAATAGFVKLWPIGFNFKAYDFVIHKKEFVQAFRVSVERLVLGTLVNMLLTVITAYPLSKESKVFKARTLYAWFFVITILVGGGLVPWYMTIRYYGIMDSIWALVLPSALPVFNMILLLNFFRGLPKEMEESAFLDGAGHWTILFKIYIPTSLPALATVTLFTMVNHWNSWFDGLILMNKTIHYPLQTYLQTVVIDQDMSVLAKENLKHLSELSNRTVKAAQIFIGSLPILLVYPLMQRYFISGIVLGSVKG